MLGGERLPDRLQIVAGIKAFRNLADVLAERLAVAQESRPREYIDLRAGVVDIIFPDDIVAGEGAAARVSLLSARLVPLRGTTAFFCVGAGVRPFLVAVLGSGSAGGSGASELAATGSGATAALGTAVTGAAASGVGGAAASGVGGATAAAFNGGGAGVVGAEEPESLTAPMAATATNARPPRTSGALLLRLRSGG